MVKCHLECVPNNDGSLLPDARLVQVLALVHRRRLQQILLLVLRALGIDL